MYGQEVAPSERKAMWSFCEPQMLCCKNGEQEKRKKGRFGRRRERRKDLKKKGERRLEERLENHNE